MQLEILGVNIGLGDKLRDHIERQLWSALGRFAARIDRLTIRLIDINGPRGGVDKRCRIAAALIPRGLVIVEGEGDDPFALIGRTAKRTGRSVRRALDRRRRGRTRLARAATPAGGEPAPVASGAGPTAGPAPSELRESRPRPRRAPLPGDARDPLARPRPARLPAPESRPSPI